MKYLLILSLFINSELGLSTSILFNENSSKEKEEIQYTDPNDDGTEEEDPQEEGRFIWH
ncbi:hypothetical protein [Tenacibaculum aiptasiae]|uniref:hypothetical protein n=1 Tax=Tenacibaculum aiptasiae TaxID=426481 RepID=UPI00232FFED9|nr:hypothetical protein [Tenacibaculum aiptasiae]